MEFTETWLNDFQSNIVYRVWVFNFGKNHRVYMKCFTRKNYTRISIEHWTDYNQNVNIDYNNRGLFTVFISKVSIPAAL